MTTPLPLIALAEKTARAPSDSPAAACWLANPSTIWVQLDRREQAIEQLLHFFYRLFPPDITARWKAEAAGHLPSEALKLFASRLDDPLPLHTPPRPYLQRPVS
jgi:hypothetical protein